MNQELDAEKMQRPARQLSCPEGEEGIKTGEQMALNNGRMMAFTIDTLALRDGETVLEMLLRCWKSAVCHYRN